MTLTSGTTDHTMLYTAEYLCLYVLPVLFLEACNERVTSYYFRLVELLGKSVCITGYLFSLTFIVQAFNSAVMPRVRSFSAVVLKSCARLTINVISYEPKMMN